MSVVEHSNAKRVLFGRMYEQIVLRGKFDRNFLLVYADKCEIKRREHMVYVIFRQWLVFVQIPPTDVVRVVWITARDLEKSRAVIVDHFVFNL